VCVCVCVCVCVRVGVRVGGYVRACVYFLSACLLHGDSKGAL
jgi:hypothetical protein